MMKIYLCLFLLIVSIRFSYSQMVVGQDTLVGNEWIRYEHRYFKFFVEQDGIYRISKATLESAGIASEDLIGADFRIYNMGRQIPLFVSTENIFGASDFIEFYGVKNRGELDQYIFRRQMQDMLNPDVSMYTDRNAYYLAYEGTDIPLRTNIILNDLTNLPPQEDYYLHTETILYNAEAIDPYFPLSEGGSVSYSSYMLGEGFAKLNENSSNTLISALNRSMTGPEATLHLRFASTNNVAHVFVVTFNNQTIDSISLNNQQISDKVYTLPLALLADNNELKIIAKNALSRHSLVKIELTYPHTSSLPQTSDILVTLNGQPGDQYHVLSDYIYPGEETVIYTIDGLNRMSGATDAMNNILFKWPQVLNNDVSLHLAGISGVRSIVSLEEKRFIDLASDDTEYIVITHPALMEIGTDSEFLQYRSSADGGGYKAKAYSILDLYDQFGYGVEKHPQSIRNFVEFFDRNWPSAKMIFIVGRAIEYNRSRFEGGTWEDAFFVPTFGRPGSDNLLAATLWDLVPRYPIGRLAIVNPQTLSDYLEKVKEHDASRFAAQTIEAKAWIKNVMHLGGGKTAVEQNDFKATLLSLGDDLAESDYGAKIHFFQKTSTDQVGASQSAQILKLLNEGCGIINYLGHSASTTFEFNINDPAEWNNHGRYPVFSAMGCSAGQIHGALFSLSDNYVQIHDEGSIAFISGSGSQFASALVGWARPWYNYIGETGYGRTLGESLLHALDAISGFVNPELTSSNQYRFLLEQQTFQGDPALRLHPMPGPDYLVDPGTVSIEPQILNTKLDSFDVTFSIVNIGRNLQQDVAYTISIRKPDGISYVVLHDTVQVRTYEAHLTVKLPLSPDTKPGSYRLLIEVDPHNILAELPSPEAEGNNKLIDNLGIEGVEFLVVDNLITAAYPPDFSIVTNTVPELVATSSNSFLMMQDIVIEIDTSVFFNSPSLVREKFLNHSSTLKWSPSINFVPDRVYFWRVSADSISPEQSFLWSRRSFIYKPGSQNGWNQSHFHQLTDNTLHELLVDSTRRDFTFGSKSRNFNILNRFHHTVAGIIPRVVEDGVIKAEFFTGFRDRNVQAFVVVIDSLTGEYFKNPAPGLYGSANHLSFPTKVFPYRMDVPESRQDLINFVENIVKPGDYVFFYTYQRTNYPDYFPEQWEADEAVFGKSIFSMIENQYPSSAIRTLATTGSKPYIVFFQKDRGGIVELIAADTADVISYSYDIQLSLKKGEFVSTLIGPAQSWASIQHEIVTTAADTAGRNILSAWALSGDLSDTMEISSNLISQDTSIAGIDAEAYPYLQLSLQTQDSVTYHPADIIYWRVLYDGYPELIINPGIGFSYIADTLLQGETMQLSTYVENVSDYDVDTMPVALRIISGTNTTEELRYIIPQLPAHSNAPVDFQKQTKEMSGPYRVLMEVNPERSVKEYNYANNIGILPLYVEGDRLNPVLDVTFDGNHILDGDLVSSRPLIVISLHDENQYLRLDDTSSFAIFIKFPSEFEPRQISFNESWVQFNQASGTGQNIATVELRPELLEDGQYNLQVKARDASGNFAGDNDFLISFRVINAESISHLYNYPNPFSTATRFVYTLTGAESPPYYKIQIMSLSGKVVREITQYELGPLDIGTHMTDFVWDGTDESGDRLAAGTYIYRMIVKDNDLKDFDRYETSGDKTYFNKGWGKLVILR